MKHYYLRLATETFEVSEATAKQLMDKSWESFEAEKLPCDGWIISLKEKASPAFIIREQQPSTTPTL